MKRVSNRSSLTRKEDTSIPFQELYLIPSKNGVTKPKRIRGNGVRMINMGELFSCDRIGNIPLELAPVTESEIKRFSLQREDLLFARRSIILEGAGKCSIIADVPSTTIFESSIIRVRLNPELVNPYFYFYYFVSEPGKARMQTIVSQLTIAGIRGSELAELKVPYPKLEYQDTIVTILSAYDDLIENNRRRIQLLEEMARILYREWFVHFRFPGHEDVEMVDSELGEIPKNWSITEMSQIVSLERKGVNPRKYDEEIFAHYSFRACDEGKLPVFQYGKEINSNKYGVEREYVLISKLNPRFPRVWMPILYHKNMGIASTDFLTLKSKESYSAPFVYCLLSSTEFLDRFTSMVTGTSTSHQRVKPDDFLKMKTPNYPEEIVQQFAGIVFPILHMQHNLRLCNETLRVGRDILLPKLVSGQLDVSKLELEIPPDTHKTSKYSDQPTLEQWLDGDDKHDPS